ANSIDISDKEFIKELIAQISREQLNDVVQEMLKTQSNILEEMSQIKGDQNKKQMSKALGVATRIPEAYKEQFIGTKKDMMLEIDDIDNKIAQLQEQKKLAQKELQQFETAKDKLANYNFGSETGREIKGELESMKILAESDPDAFAEKVEEFTNSVDASIIKAKKEKLNKGIIQFQDVDDNEWFFSHVTDAKNANIVSGVKDAEGNITGFDPGGNLTKAQILKIALEAAGIDVKEVGGAWWKGYYETAKERNFNITKRNNESQVGNFSNRGEAIGLILEALAVEPSDPSEISFPDVSKNHPYAGYIEKAKKLGIISGRPDGTFGPDDNVNRAETMKMTMNALQITGKGITTN
ncbi:S-layer homology domain-containing protein, partial [Patescibacteria group bacterium]|nr:S-layer homology domain-containing protein [Patescibacteria group bacterium]